MSKVHDRKAVGMKAPECYDVVTLSIGIRDPLTFGLHLTLKRTTPLQESQTTQFSLQDLSKYIS